MEDDATASRPHGSMGQGRDDHYQRTLANFALVESENLHIVGYFDDEHDSLVAALDNLNRHLAGEAGVKAQDVLLDIGCGSGGPACSVAQITGCHVVGIDIGRAQLEEARRKAAEKRLADRVLFEECDATALTFAAGSFDAVLMVGVASNIENLSALFGEAARVLKPGGRLVFADAVTHDPEWFEDRANAFQVKVLRTFFAGPRIGAVDEYSRLLRDNGLEVHDVEDLYQHVTRSFRAWQETFEQREGEIVERLGKGRYRALVKSMSVIASVVEDRRLTFVLFKATRGAVA